jgi:hypothetical protein
MSEADEATGTGSEEPMITKAEARELITDLFEEEALLIGGLIAVHKIDDDLVWRLVKNLDVIRAKTLRRLDHDELQSDAGSATSRPNLKPHPAIQDFLLALRRA